MDDRIRDLLRNSYTLLFWNLPLVQDDDIFRAEFIADLKRSLPSGFDSSIVDVSPPIPRTDHREKLVNRNDPSGNENILLCNYVFVPVDNLTEYLLLEAIWHGREYYGRRIAVRRSHFGFKVGQ